MKKVALIALAALFALVMGGCAQAPASSAASASSQSAQAASGASAAAASQQASAEKSTAVDDDEDDADDADDSAEFISEDDAKSAAVTYVGMGLPEEVDADLVVGGDAAHYVVTMTSGAQTHIVEVDAFTGEVWSDTVEDAADDDADDDDDDADADDGGEFISEDAAKSAAVTNAGMGLPDEVDVELVTGGDAPHYVVTLTSGDETRVMEVDAYTGVVW